MQRDGRWLAHGRLRFRLSLKLSLSIDYNVDRKCSLKHNKAVIASMVALMGIASLLQLSYLLSTPLIYALHQLMDHLESIKNVGQA